MTVLVHRRKLRNESPEVFQFYMLRVESKTHNHNKPIYVWRLFSIIAGGNEEHDAYGRRVALKKFK